MKECIVTSSVLIMVVILIRVLFREKISRRLQYALWGLVLLRLLIPFPLLGSQFSIMNVVEAGVTQLNTHVATDASSLLTLAPAALESGATELNDAASPTADEQDMTASGVAAHEPITATDVFTIVWLIGSIAIGIWMIGANLVFLRRLKSTQETFNAVDCKLPVYVTNQIASPCLFGILRPSVYLTPAAAENPDYHRFVLTHELCHYRHGDHIWSMLRGLCLALYWWNPLVWVAAILSRSDSELACDESVIQKIGVANRLAYGHTLVDMIAVKKAPAGLLYAATTMVSDKRGLKERLNMIIKNPKTLLPALIAALILIAVCVGCTFTGAQAASLSAQEALDELEASVTCSDSQVSFQIPGEYETPENWNIHIAGRQEFEDGFSQSVHLLEDVNDTKTWTPGKQYTIDLTESFTELTLTASLPDQDGNILEKSIDLLANYAQQLYDCRNSYIGDAPADSALLNALGISDQLGAYTLELETETEPYVLRLNFTEQMTDNVAAFNREMRKNAFLLLALIGNASEIQWHYSYLDETAGGGGSATCSLILEEANAALGVDNIKSYGQSSAGMQSLLEQLQTDTSNPTDYELIKLGSNGEVLYSQRLMWAHETQLADSIIFNYLIKSTAWPGTDVSTLDECYLLRATYSDGTTSDYYAFLLDGNAVMQTGKNGLYSPIDNELYERLVQLTQSSYSWTD